MSDKPSKFAGILRNRQETPEVETVIKRGRPGGKGKRNHPDYAQVTAYIPKTLHNETKVNLIRQGNQEFSVLVEELLTVWNGKQAGSR
jgi:hypothetical protein